MNLRQLSEKHSLTEDAKNDVKNYIKEYLSVSLTGGATPKIMKERLGTKSFEKFSEDLEFAFKGFDDTMEDKDKNQTEIPFEEETKEPHF